MNTKLTNGTRIAAVALALVASSAALAADDSTRISARTWGFIAETVGYEPVIRFVPDFSVPPVLPPMCVLAGNCGSTPGVVLPETASCSGTTSWARCPRTARSTARIATSKLPEAKRCAAREATRCRHRFVPFTARTRAHDSAALAP
jgi:hypothetical protein